MLVLTRKKGERVMIGDDIVVTVIDVRGDGVRIGFDAPRGVSIQRAEVVSAVKEANTGAAASAAQTPELLLGLLTKARKPEAPPAPAPATSQSATPQSAAPQSATPQSAAAAPATSQPTTPQSATPQSAAPRLPAGPPPKPAPPRP